MSSQHSHPPELSAPAKLPIPRLERRNGHLPKPAGVGKQRVQRACLSCRARKVRCNGGRPKCKNCENNSTDCIYTSTRKDRLKMATEQNQVMIRLLQGLRDHVQEPERNQIQELLDLVIDDVDDAASFLKKLRDKPYPMGQDEERGEANVSTEVGSNIDLDRVDEDPLRSEESPATGFVGKNSVIQWMCRLHCEVDRTEDHGSRYDGPYGPLGSSNQARVERVNAIKECYSRDPELLIQTSHCNFYLDDENIDIDLVVNPFELPPYETAERLLDCYMSTVQNQHPILSKESFVNQYRDCYDQEHRDTPYRPPRKWQAILNLVFAIGAVYSHLTEVDWRVDERDHLVYYLRAWNLGLKDPCWFSHPDLVQLQATGLLAFYYLSIGHVNRSWAVVGVALRFGYALGLHSRNEDCTASSVKQEHLSRSWWGLYSLESNLSIITGRPSVGIESQCSVPLPLPIAAHDINEATIHANFGDAQGDTGIKNVQPSTRPSLVTLSGRNFSEVAGVANEPTNSGSYLKVAVKIGILTHKTLIDLYSAGVMRENWESIQRRVAELNERLEAWAAALPQGFHLLRNHHGSYQRERCALELYYHSAKVLIMRPCLCRIDHRTGNQTHASNEFNKRAADQCVSAAKSIANLLPEPHERNRVKIYHVGPWWSIVHYIMQAVAILFLQISDGLELSVKYDMDTITSIKKLLRWLRIMRTSNAMAARAYTISFDLLQKMVAHRDVDISDLLFEDASFPRAPASPCFPQPTAAANLPEIPNSQARLPPQPPTSYSPIVEPACYSYQITDAYCLSNQAAAAAYPGFQPEVASENEQRVHSFFSNMAPTSGYAFPNLFVTAHDEHNPLSNQGIWGDYQGQQPREWGL